MSGLSTIWNLGKSTEGRPLDVVAFAPQKQALPSEPNRTSFPVVLLLGGVHGDEVEGVWLMRAVREHWHQNFLSTTLGAIVWPEVNPDGVAKNQRWNARQIDLNRNLPSRDWSPEVKNPRYPPGPEPASEPENKALVGLIAKTKPIAILSAHSFHKFQVNANGPSREWAERLSQKCGYPVTEDIGYPTPGCLGTYTGKEMGIPTITLEIERGLSHDKVLTLHLGVIEETLNYWTEKTCS